MGGSRTHIPFCVVGHLAPDDNSSPGVHPSWDGDLARNRLKACSDSKVNIELLINEISSHKITQSALGDDGLLTSQGTRHLHRGHFY